MASGILSREGAWDELGWSEARKDKEREYFAKQISESYGQFMRTWTMAATMAGQTLPQEATAQNRLLRSRSNRLAATVLRLWHKHAQPDFDIAFAT